MGSGERAARRRLVAFEGDLNDPSAWMHSRMYSPERPFVPAALNVYVRPYRAVADPSLPEPALRWPLAAGLRTFGRPTPELPGARCGTVEGDAATSVRRVGRNANQLTLWRSRDDTFVRSRVPASPSGRIWLLTQA
jgi:hypothetical protein